MRIDYLALLEEGFFYENTLGTAIKLMNQGKLAPVKLRRALNMGLKAEMDKYTLWLRSDGSFWQSNLEEARQAFRSNTNGDVFHYKGVKVDLQS